MENKNLNDIVIEDADNTKKTQLKNILTLLALLFVILVISIVITKLILGEDTENPIDTEAVIATETTNDTDENTSASTTLSNVATAAGTALATATTTVADGTKDVIDATKAPLLTERNTTSNTKQPLREIKDPKKDEAKNDGNAPKASTYSRPKYVATEDKPKSTPKQETKSYNPTRGYYIKVGTFSDPSTAVKKIKAIGLSYREIKSSEGLTRILIGPFYSQKDAEDHLEKAKANVAKDAYITKIK